MYKQIIRLYALINISKSKKEFEKTKDEILKDSTLKDVHKELVSRGIMFIQLPRGFEYIYHSNIYYTTLNNVRKTQKKPDWDNILDLLYLEFYNENISRNKDIINTEVEKCKKEILKSLIEKGNRSTVKDKEIITIEENYETHIKVRKSNDYKLNKNRKCETKWTELKIEDIYIDQFVLESLSYNKNLKDMSNRKVEELESEELKAYYLVLLLVKTWHIIKKFFPLQRWGLPTHVFMESLLNIITGNDFVKISDIDLYSFNTNDIYSLKKEHEIRYLKNKLQEFGVDIEKEKVKDGFIAEITYLEEILNNEQMTIFRFDSSPYKSRNRKQKSEPKDLRGKFTCMIKKMKEEIHAGASFSEELKFKIETYFHYIDEIVKLKDEGNLSNKKIANRLNKDEKEIDNIISTLKNEIGLNNLL